MARSTRSPGCCRCARARPSRSTRMQRVLAILNANSIFNVLGENNVKRQPIEIDQRVRTRVARRRAVRHRDRAVRGGRQGRVVSRRQGASRRRRWRGRHARACASPTRRAASISISSPPARRVTDDLKSRLAGAPPGVLRWHGVARRRNDRRRPRHTRPDKAMGHIAMSGEHGAIDSAGRPRHRPKDVSAYQQLQPGAAARLGRAQERWSRRDGKFPPTEWRSRYERR